MRNTLAFAAWIFAFLLLASLCQRAQAQTVNDQEQGTLTFTNVTTPITNPNLLVYQEMFGDSTQQILIYDVALGNIPAGNSTETGIFNPIIGMGDVADGLIIAGQYSPTNVALGLGTSAASSLQGQPYNNVFTSTPVTEATLITALNADITTTTGYDLRQNTFADFDAAINISALYIPLTTGSPDGQFLNFSNGSPNGTITFTDDGTITPGGSAPSGDWSNVSTGGGGGSVGAAVPLPPAADSALALLTAIGAFAFLRKTLRNARLR